MSKIKRPKIEPFAAYRLPELPEDDPDFDNAVSDLATVIMGFPHPGAKADALVYTLRWLRQDPDMVRRLGLV